MKFYNLYKTLHENLDREGFFETEKYNVNTWNYEEASRLIEVCKRGIYKGKEYYLYYTLNRERGFFESDTIEMEKHSSLYEKDLPPEMMTKIKERTYKGDSLPPDDFGGRDYDLIEKERTYHRDETDQLIETLWDLDGKYKYERNHFIPDLAFAEEVKEDSGISMDTVLILETIKDWFEKNVEYDDDL